MTQQCDDLRADCSTWTPPNESMEILMQGYLHSQQQSGAATCYVKYAEALMGLRWMAHFNRISETKISPNGEIPDGRTAKQQRFIIQTHMHFFPSYDFVTSDQIPKEWSEEELKNHKSKLHNFKRQTDRWVRLALMSIYLGPAIFFDPTVLWKNIGVWSKDEWNVLMAVISTDEDRHLPPFHQWRSADLKSFEKSPQQIAPVLRSHS